MLTLRHWSKAGAVREIDLGDEKIMGYAHCGYLRAKFRYK
jgi:hypothetical protein